MLNTIIQTDCSHICAEYVQQPSGGVCDWSQKHKHTHTHTYETSNLQLVYHELLTCSHGLHVFHDLLGSAQVGNIWVPLFWSRPKTKYFSLQKQQSNLSYNPNHNCDHQYIQPLFTGHNKTLESPAHMIQNAAVS